MFLFRGGGNQTPLKILSPIDYFFKQQNISCVKRVFNYDNSKFILKKLAVLISKVCVERANEIIISAKTSE